MKRVTVDSTTIISLIKAGSFGENKDKLLKQYGMSLFTLREFKEVKSLPTKKKLMELGIVKDEADFKDKETCLIKYNAIRYEEYKQKENERYKGQMKGFVDKYVTDEKMFEFDSMGTFLTNNPLTPFRSYFNPLEIINEGDKCLLGGTFLKVTRKRSKKNGSTFAKVDLLTLDGVVSGMIFGDSLSKYNELVAKNNTVVMLCKKNNGGFIVDKVRTFEEWSKTR
jgi:DNA polymerase III subunit alpha